VNVKGTLFTVQKALPLMQAGGSESNGKVAGPNGAAAKLGIPRSTLDLKIKQLKIEKHTIRYVPSLNSQNSGTSQHSVTPISFSSLFSMKSDWVFGLH